jgi:hypothetical protein
MLNAECLRMCSSWRRPLNAVCKTFNVNVKQERQARGTACLLMNVL